MLGSTRLIRILYPRRHFCFHGQNAMGDKNVPVVFNNMMRSYSGIPNTEVYFDDILLGANTKDNS